MLPCSRFRTCRAVFCPVWAESLRAGLWGAEDPVCGRVRLPGGVPRWLLAQRAIVAAGIGGGPWSCSELGRARIENGAVVIPREHGLARELRWVGTLTERGGPPASDEAQERVAVLRGYRRPTLAMLRAGEGRQLLEAAARG